MNNSLSQNYLVILNGTGDRKRKDNYLILPYDHDDPPSKHDLRPRVNETKTYYLETGGHALLP